MNTLKANQKGFTMVELMITVTVIAILTTVAVPAYNDYVIRGKLQEATSALSAGRVQLEQFYQDNRTYVGALCTAAGTNWPAATANFTYNCSGATNSAYTITATGIGGISLFVLTIDQANTKRTTGAIAGWGSTPANCWHVKKGGSC